MKNKIITNIGIVLIILLLAIAGVQYYKLNKTQGSAEKNYSNFNYLQILSEQDLKTKINSGETFFIYVGRPDCSDSRKFNKEFEQLFVELNDDGEFVDLYYELDKKNLYYFNSKVLIDSLSDTDKRMLVKDQYGFYFTPSLVAYSDKNNDGISEVINIAEWNSIDEFNISDYMKWFYDNGLISPSDLIYHEGQSNKK